MLNGKDNHTNIPTSLPFSLDGHIVSSCVAQYFEHISLARLFSPTGSLERASTRSLQLGGGESRVSHCFNISVKHSSVVL